ncbi:MAG: TlpA family protein disulfide reductase [Alphaproteobacteria bacterium]|nr:TlpA family protein disulfide reductase [Alphaproteobacteria bacterium]
MLRGLAELLLMVVAAGAVVMIVGRLRAPDLPDGAPDFELTDLDGKEWQLSELRGQPVVLNFWATWCGPCKLEIPAFSDFARENPDVVVLGLATDGREAELRAASKQLGIAYPVIRADAETIAAYGVDTLPTTVIIDADGQVHTAHTGIMLGPQLKLAVSGAR